VHPWRLEKPTVLIFRFQRISVTIENHNITRLLCEFEHIAGQAGDFGTECRFSGFSQVVVVFILACFVPLQLTAPNPAEIDIVRTIIVLIGRWVYTETALHRLRHGLVRAFGFVTDRNADSKNIVLIFCGKIHVISPVLAGHIVGPHLTTGPGHIFDIERDTMIAHVPPGILHRIHVIIAHIKVASCVILGNSGLDIVRGENINFAVVHMGPRIRRVNTFYQMTRFSWHNNCLSKEFPLFCQSDFSAASSCRPYPAAPPQGTFVHITS